MYLIVPWFDAMQVLAWEQGASGVCARLVWVFCFFYARISDEQEGAARKLGLSHIFSTACHSPLQFSHLAWIQTDRKAGGLGDLAYPLVADITKSISKAFNVLIENDVSYSQALQ